ncbi:tetratricopeptide repeat protein [Selenomonas ruminantium]|uniref:tetratricopeptide repeat protein n=1 Tax=Selenomonas ruminantium TaxID=971 RepID=UPI0004069F12|nr:CDC27 family protein [Selenomonas ruminantium]
MEIRSNNIESHKKKVQQEGMPKGENSILTMIAQYLKDEEYNLVLEKLAELINDEVYDAEAMYAGAYSYFMMGDYDRAADWINNTLTYNPQHLKVRILLARLLLLNDRVDDAIALYEYVLKHGGNTLDKDVLEEITCVGEGYAGQKAQSIGVDYPEIAKLIGNIDCPDEKTICKNTINDTKDTKTDAINICHKIMMEKQSLEYKLVMLNKFAGSFYLKGQLHDAETLLLSALDIDSADEKTLRNMVMVQIGLGRIEKAGKMAAEMCSTDFVLLKKIHSC